ncbi:hypothetical protein AAC387_Pa08g0622 [Persea americana]
MALLLKPSSSLTQTLSSSYSSTSLSTNPNFSAISYPSLHGHGGKQPKLLLSKGAAIQSNTISSSNHHHMVGFLLLFQEFGFNEKEIEGLLERNPVLAYASPKSLRNRLLSLKSVGLVEFAIWRLITRHPDILTAEELDGFLDFVRERLEGIEPRKLERVLIGMEPGFLVGFAEKVELLVEHGVPEEKLGHFINSISLRVFCGREAEEIERLMVFFKQFDFSLILRRPLLLNLDLDTQIIPRIQVFQEELGGEEEAVKILLRKLPRILSYSAEHFQDQIEFWRSIGLSEGEIFKIFLVYPGVVGVSKERKLKPRVEFLKECGLNANDIYRFLSKAPLFLSLSFEDNLSKKLGFLVKLGYKRRTRELAFAMGAVTRTSCENMQLVIGVFLSYGLSTEDVFAMSNRHPQVLQYNHSSLEKKMEYLIEEMGREIGELLAFPAFLGYKLERIKRRYEVKKEARGEGMSLNKLLSVSTETFLKKKSSREEAFELYEVNKV